MRVGTRAVVEQQVDRPRLEIAYTRNALAALNSPDSPVHTRLKLLTEEPILVKDRVSFELTPTHDCYVLLINMATDGSLYLLFPNPVQPDHLVRAGQRVTIPNGRWALRVRDPAGVDTVKVIATVRPVDLGDLRMRQIAGQFFEVPADRSGELVRHVMRHLSEESLVSEWGAESVSFAVGVAARISPRLRARIPWS